MTSESAIHRWTRRRLAVAAGALVMGLAALVLVIRLDYGFDGWFVGESAIAGGFLGNLLWLFAAPRRRVTRLAAALTGLSLAVWLGFLVFGARHIPEKAQSLDDAYVVIHDAPIMVAGRSVGTFGAVNAADRILNVMAGPAVFYVSGAMTLASPVPPVESVGGSYAVAGIACVLSTAFWLAAGNGLAARLERRRALRHGPRTPS